MKRILVLVLALVTASLAHAQDNFRRDSAINSTLNLIGPRKPLRSNLEMWVVGQGGLSQMSSNQDQTAEMKNHDVYGGGMLLNAGRGAIMGEFGVLYFQEGLNATEKIGSSKQTAIGDMDYVGLPVMGKWNALRRGRTRLSMGLGLMDAIYVGSNLKVQVSQLDASGNVVSTSETEKEAVGARKNNIMALATIGGDIGLSRSQDMRIEVMYRRGLLPVTDRDDSGVYTNSVVMNLGFGFDI